MDLMSIGEFARRSRLSQKALRLYDELALLRPARVDPDSGYRWYDPAQLDQARLVVALRELGVPLARITVILGLAPDTAAEEIGAFWAAAETRHAARRELTGYLVDRLTGRRITMYEVTTRRIAARQVLCLLRHVADQQALFDLGKSFISRLRDVPAARLPGIDGATFLIYYGQVDKDGDGPVEWCRPVPDDAAHELAARFPELTLRTEPAHEEAFVALGTAEVPEAQWQVISDSLQSWVGEHQRQPSDLGARMTYLGRPSITENSRPECDFAIPLR